jgi:steroid delta-isomerase-like uncharacterized protein
MSAENVTLVRRMVEDHWNRRNAALVPELFASNVSLQTPDGPLSGHSGAMALLQTYDTGFPDFRINIDELLDAGEHVVLQWRFTGTFRGSLAGIPPTGRSVNMTPGIAIFRVEGGKISAGRLVWDKYELLQQMGVLTVTASGA